MPGVFAQERLAEYQEQFSKVTKDGPAYPYGVPVIARLVDAHCDVSSTGKEMIKEKWTILEGEFEGTTVNLNQFPFSHPISLGRWKMWAFILGGFADASIADIEEIVASIANAEPIAKIRLKQSGGFINYDLIERVDASEVSAAPRVAPAARKAAPAAPASDEEPQEEPTDEPTAEFDIGTVVEFTTALGDDPTPQTIQGTITAVDADGLYTAVYDDGTPPPWEITELKASDLTPVVDEIPDELRALAEAAEIPIADEDTTESVVEKMKGYEWQEADLTEAEIAALKGADVPVIEKPKPKPKTVVKRKPATTVKPKPKAKAARRK
ncbi:MAG TPA: hypothetical protein VMZ92_12870 [Planctomycetota bacterium]|nr:hypothetical protein [Planctomycetota bacterium]